jgi:hypothetical protein
VPAPVPPLSQDELTSFKVVAQPADSTAHAPPPAAAAAAAWLTAAAASAAVLAG